MSEIKVGTCGYGFYKPPKDWREEFESKLQAYSDIFKVGEINRTFYKLPMVKTTKRWRCEAFDDFEFTLKAWQALTHPTSSPTWRKRRDKLTEKQLENFGHLRPNQEVIDAWNETKKRAEALEAKICVIQTPGSFDSKKGNKKNMRELLGEIDRGDLELAWEPRGDWKENPDEVKEICDDLNLIHIVDLMRRDPVSDHPIAYIRLHGLNPREYDYDYDYSDEELEKLAGKLENLAENQDEVYCMFNNYEMYDNAQRLMEFL